MNRVGKVMERSRIMRTFKALWVEEWEDVAGTREQAYNSGLFCVSITAAIGIPKFETGPQKSILH
jgi:hypothetical protein